MRLIGIVLLALVLAPANAAQVRKLYPVDEGPRDRSFVQLRQKVTTAARKRDRSFIWSIVDPKIRWSFGADTGIQGFKRHWTEAAPGALEAELIRLLSLGGEFKGKGEFWAPYVYSRWPEQYDAFQYLAVTGKHVNVRRRPSLESAVDTRLSYDIVKRVPESPSSRSGPSPSEPAGWVNIITPGSWRGFIAARYARSPIDYRANFRKRDGRWRMTAMVAGD